MDTNKKGEDEPAPLPQWIQKEMQELKKFKNMTISEIQEYLEKRNKERRKSSDEPSTTSLSDIAKRLKEAVDASSFKTRLDSGDASEPDEIAKTSLRTAELLKKYVNDLLGSFEDELPERDAVLEAATIDAVASYMKSGRCTNIITMAGAGISTSAGIPDFRSPGTGLYYNLQKYNLPHPQAIFELDYFNIDAKPFFVLAKELYPGSFKPTVCHYFIKLLNEKGNLLRHYTQNIDTLERVAGIPEEKLIEAHGTFYTGHCLGCRRKYDLEWMKEKIFKDEIPYCLKCPGVVKPDIVFFGENLPDKFYDSLHNDFKKCDLLIVMGSTLTVQPFASLVDMVPDSCPRLLINREKVGHEGGIWTALGYGGGLNFDDKNNKRDVLWLGNCDDGCQQLADKLGWGDELRELVKKEHARIDQENEIEKLTQATASAKI